MCAATVGWKDNFVIQFIHLTKEYDEDNMDISQHLTEENKSISVIKWAKETKHVVNKQERIICGARNVLGHQQLH